MSTRARRPDRRAVWMNAFEDRCLAAGIPYTTIHGSRHQEFWASAAFYYTSGVSVDEAVRRFKEGFDDKIADNLLDAINMKEVSQ